MKELSKTNRLTIVVVAIVLVFTVGMLSISKPELKYELNPAQSLVTAQDTTNYIYPAQLQKLLTTNDCKTEIIDVRNSIAFNRGHIAGARNIPVRELFSEHNLAYFKDMENGNQTALIYGETPQQANGPWMMLRQLGFQNVRLINGTFGQLYNPENDTTSGILSLGNEIPLIDTAALKKLAAPVASAEQSSQKPKPAKKIVVPVKTEPSSGGGC